MPLLLYTACFYLLLPLIVLRLYQRSLRAPAYRRRIAERFARFRPPAWRESLWVHAVSVGEVIAAVPLIRALQQRYPDLPIVVTTMTPTGSERVQTLLGDSVFHVYAPYDVPVLIRRFIRQLRPRLLIIMETEIWPNTVIESRRAGVDVVLANARLSEKSARGYARLAALTRRVFGQISRVVAQTEADARRFQALGVPARQLRVSGSIKFDIAIDDGLRAEATAERQRLGAAQRPVWLCASTHEGEEELILRAFSRLRAELPDLLLLIAPRHPERFDRVADLIGAADLDCQRRSDRRADTPRQVLLIDTMGELLLLFGCADVATVGGSLIARGGHNSLEPAAWGLSLVNGESDFNFAEISRLLRAAGALRVVSDSESLAREVGVLLADPVERRRRGAAAAAVVAENRGALDRLLQELESLLSRGQRD